MPLRRATLATALLGLAACGSQPPFESESAAGSPVQSAPTVPATTLDPRSSSDDDRAAPSTAPVDTAVAREPSIATDADPVDVSIVATGAGGCIDGVGTDELSTAVSDPEGWASFDLILENNCGDLGRTVAFSAAPGDRGVSVRAAICDDVVACDGDDLVVALDGLSRPAVRFQVDRAGSVAELLAGSPYTVDLPAEYRYGVDTLDDEPFDITIMIEVRPAVPIEEGVTTPTQTREDPVEVVGGGFDLLDFPFVGFADTPTDLSRLFADAITEPEGFLVDWGTHAAVVFTIPTDLCPPVLTGLDVVDGTATPVFENPGYPGCEQPLLSHTTVATVDRDVLADVDRIVLPADDPFFAAAVHVDIDASARTGDGADDVASSREFGEDSGRAPLPPRGEASIATLDDGAPVIVVHHHDGTVSALDPRAGGLLEGPPELRGLVRWNATNRNFFGRGVWDEFGRRIDGFPSTDMTGFATRVVIADGDATVEIGSPVAPPGGAPITATDQPPAMTDRSVELDASISLEDARSLAPGTSAIVDASVVVDPSGGFVCELDPGAGFPLPPCPVGSSPVDGIAPLDGFRSAYFGPLLVTRTETGFTRVASTGGTSGQSLDR